MTDVHALLQEYIAAHRGGGKPTRASGSSAWRAATVLRSKA